MDNRFIQGTPEWLEMRRSMIMASDAPIIMGISPWKTPRELYFEKIEGIETEETPAMIRGKKLEAEARELFEDYKGKDFPPQVIVSPSHSWMGSSLDGMGSDGEIVEIKCPGRKSHEEALQGRIPAVYFPQLQYQMLVTGASEVYYFSYNPDFEQKTVLLIQLRDEAYIANHLFPKCQAFYKCLRDKTPPPLTEKEKFKEEIGEREEVDIADEKFYFAEEELSELLEKKEKLLAREKELKEFLIQKADGKPVQGTYFSVTPKMYSGIVDYKKLVEDHKIDTTPYKKENTIRWEIRKI